MQPTNIKGYFSLCFELILHFLFCFLFCFLLYFWKPAQDCVECDKNNNCISSDDDDDDWRVSFVWPSSHNGLGTNYLFLLQKYIRKQSCAQTKLHWLYQIFILRWRLPLKIVLCFLIPPDTPTILLLNYYQACCQLIVCNQRGWTFREKQKPTTTSDCIKNNRKKKERKMTYKGYVRYRDPSPPLDFLFRVSQDATTRWCKSRRNFETWILFGIFKKTKQKHFSLYIPPLFFMSRSLLCLVRDHFARSRSSFIS